jgi:hypothetical protein
MQTSWWNCIFRKWQVGLNKQTVQEIIYQMLEGLSQGPFLRWTLIETLKPNKIKPFSKHAFFSDWSIWLSWNDLTKTWYNNYRETRVG